MFNFEFHIPHFALRRGPRIEDARRFDGHPLRKSVQLPLYRNKHEKLDHYYEVQLSLLVTGVDDWLWTSFCCVDTYHGSEPTKHEYLDGAFPTEPATAGSKSLEYPIWCPRDFFLIVLDRRMMQAVTEFKALIDAFDQRMISYVSIRLFRYGSNGDRNQITALTSRMTSIKVVPKSSN